MDAAEEDVLAFMDFPREHRAKLHSTNPTERLNGETKRRTDVVGIFPNEAAVVRLVGALLLEQSDEWATQRSRYMTLETITAVSDTLPSACQLQQSDAAAQPARSTAPTPRPGTGPSSASITSDGLYTRSSNGRSNLISRLSTHPRWLADIDGLARRVGPVSKRFPFLHVSLPVSRKLI